MTLACLLLNSPPAWSELNGAYQDNALEEEFIDPPSSARPRVWWHWMNGNVTEEGIRLDLEWMKRIGIGGLQNFDAYLATPQLVHRRLVYMTPEWKRAFRFAADLSDKLGLELAVASSPGWSETGGPWVQPKDGMKKFVWSETTVEGGRRFLGTLSSPPSVTGPFQDMPSEKELVATDTAEDPPEFYADAAVVAYRVPDDEPPPLRLTSSGGAVDAEALGDGKLQTLVELPAGTAAAPAWLRADFRTPRSVSSATLGLKVSASLLGSAIPHAHLEASEDGITFRRIASFPTGSVPQQTISFEPVVAMSYRVCFDPFGNVEGLERLGHVAGAVIVPFGVPADFKTLRVTEFALYENARVNLFEQKAGFGTVPDYYAIDTSPNVHARPVPAADVVDLSGRLNASGELNWTPPPGRWRVLRLGYSLTGKKNHPATPEATGLEVDKLDRTAVKSYIETYVNSFAAATGPDLIGARGLRALLNDSIEVGAMNWTTDMIEQFRKRRGYDPHPWLPVLTGTIINSSEDSDSFLYDFRRTIGELLAESHYKQIADSVHARGMTQYAEALESGRPTLGDDLEIRRYADVPMAAMWTFQSGSDPKTAHQADIRGAASVAHVYGQNLVAAESLTAAFAPWAFSPSDLKPMIDMAFALGVNRPVIHTSVHQPFEKRPGLSLAIFGQYFNRHETWAELAKPWVDYISRSDYLLQQGRFFADIAYFYGEEAPLTALFADKPLTDVPEGYGYDFVNSDIVLNQFSVSAGRLTTERGASYRVLYLGGSSERMTLPVLRGLERLVEAGATIIGKRPTRSPSLGDDRYDFARISERLWGSGPIGQGRVIDDRNLYSALRTINLPPDFYFTSAEQDSKVMFVHRRLSDGDIYYLSNRQARTERIDAHFRVTGKRPEVWRADNGTFESTSYQITNGQTVVPLTLNPNDAVFVVFRRTTSSTNETVAPLKVRELTGVQGPWTVRFEADQPAPAETLLKELASLSENEDLGIRYFSGTASYRTRITLPRDVEARRKIWIDLGAVGDLAEVLVNGRSCGIAWKAPYRLEIGSAVTAGDNEIEIRVTNLWVNRLIGDAQPNADKIAFTTLPTYHPTAALRPSGLMGPVSVLEQY